MQATGSGFDLRGGGEGFKSRLLMVAKNLFIILTYAIAFHLLVAASILTNYGKYCVVDLVQTLELILPIGSGYVTLKRLYNKLQRRDISKFSALTIVLMISVLVSAPTLFVIRAYDALFHIASSVKAALLYLLGSLTILTTIIPMVFLEVFYGLIEGNIEKILDSIVMNSAPPLDVYIRSEKGANVGTVARYAIKYARALRKILLVQPLLELTAIMIAALLYYWLCIIIG